MEYIKAKTIVTRSKNPSGWFGTEYNMNIYKGCCHGCIYCDSRSECYRIEDFDTVRAKENALEIIKNDLSRKVKKGTVATGAMSDPYNPFEKELCLTRHALELLWAYDFGVSIATKSDLITRDIDILKDINRNMPVIAKITITTTDPETAKITEPNAPPPKARLEAIRELSESGIFTGVLLMPLLPFISDSQEVVADIVTKAYESGAKFIYPAFGVTLRANQREYFFDKLDIHFPGHKERYIKAFGNSYSCRSVNSRDLWNIFAFMCRERGILFNMGDIISASKTGKQPMQLSLFG